MSQAHRRPTAERWLLNPYGCRSSASPAFADSVRDVKAIGSIAALLILAVASWQLGWLDRWLVDDCAPLCCAMPIVINDMIDDEHRVDIAKDGATRRGDLLYVAYRPINRATGKQVGVGVWVMSSRTGPIGAVDEVAKRVSDMEAPRRHVNSAAAGNARACLAAHH